VTAEISLIAGLVIAIATIALGLLLR